MKNNALSITAFAVVIISIVAILATVAFSQGIEKIEWMDLESIAWACFGLAILGCVLGWCSFGRPLGKVAAGLGTLVVAGFLFQLMRSDGSSMPVEVPKRISVGSASDAGNDSE